MNEIRTPYFLEPVNHKEDLLPNPTAEYGNQPQFWCIDIQLTSESYSRGGGPMMWIYDSGRWADEAVESVSVEQNHVCNITPKPISYTYHYSFRHNAGRDTVRYEDGIIATGEKISNDNYDKFRAELKDKYGLRNDTITITSLTDIT